MTPEAVVREFWRLMASNDFDSVAAVMARDVIVEWPQSRERIRGASLCSGWSRAAPKSLRRFTSATACRWPS